MVSKTREWPKNTQGSITSEGGHFMTEWFVEPRGDVAHANGVFFRELGSAEEFAREYKDEAGGSRKVWLCPSYAKVLQFWRSRGTLKIQFDVWNRERNYGPIRYVSFLMPGWRHERKPVEKTGAVDF